jgi:putative oxidoreductase
MSDMTKSWSGPALSLLRVFAGGVYIQHGVQKFSDAFGGQMAALGPLQIAGGTIECVAGALIILGLFTRGAGFIASGEMAVAYFLFHAQRGFWPVMNHGETPVLLCFIFLYLATAGGGTYSIDAYLAARRASGRSPGV